MADEPQAATIGDRIRRHRIEANMSISDLAAASAISRSYLSELENNSGNHQHPSARVVYAIGKALGVSMSELLGQPKILQPDTKPSRSLLHFAKERDLSDRDVEMLASIRFRGEPPKSAARWQFIYDAIRNSSAME
jgi:transcriptional regulator with XRE-family HTH domain